MFNIFRNYDVIKVIELKDDAQIKKMFFGLI